MLYSPMSKYCFLFRAAFNFLAEKFCLTNSAVLFPEFYFPPRHFSFLLFSYKLLLDCKVEKLYLNIIIK